MEEKEKKGKEKRNGKDVGVKEMEGEEEKERGGRSCWA